MAVSRDNGIDTTFELLSILKAIVSAERDRAQSKPFDDRNLKLGITIADQPRDKAESRIKQVFDAMQLFLDHLTIAQLAAAFENEAKSRLGTVIGESRKSIESARKNKDRWPSNLLRSAESLQGLSDIVDVLSLQEPTKSAFALIRSGRNKFTHGTLLDQVPSITADQAREALLDALEKLK